VPNALRHCPCGSGNLSPLRILASVNLPPAFFASGIFLEPGVFSIEHG
jgi:hypothetical protein